jgi:hypothetical protein
LEAFLANALIENNSSSDSNGNNNDQDESITEEMTWNSRSHGGEIESARFSMQDSSAS